jgi:nitronate monooxygenase
MTSPTRDGLLDLLRRRIVVAPMAGGPTTAGLVAAAARAGALGFLAAGYKTPEAMAAEVTAVRAATQAPFGVNVFVPGRPYPDAAALARYLDSLGPGRGDASWDDDGFDGKIAALLTDPPAVISFTFGCPAAEVIRALQEAGSAVVITVTSPAEATLAAEASPEAPDAYPEINNATRPLRAAAAARGDTEAMSLWAGQGYRLAAERPAAEIIEQLRG